MIRRDTRGNWSLIGLLVAVVVIGVVLYITLGSYLKTTHSSETRAAMKEAGAREGETPIDVAHDVECRNELDQMRKAIEMYKTQFDGGVPTNLEALTGEGVPREWLVCPVGKEPYKYDPETGRVWCVHPGHEKY